MDALIALIIGIGYLLFILLKYFIIGILVVMAIRLLKFLFF